MSVYAHFDMQNKQPLSPLLGNEENSLDFELTDRTKSNQPWAELFLFLRAILENSALKTFIANDRIELYNYGAKIHTYQAVIGNSNINAIYRRFQKGIALGAEINLPYFRQIVLHYPQFRIWFGYGTLELESLRLPCRRIWYVDNINIKNKL